jgi:predicted ATPase/tRNA A-37 threonylcarbamoyl transferase component Bud32
MTDIINNRYQLKNQLGQGGMGIVYRAYDYLTGTDVALKQVTTPQSSLKLISRATTDANPTMLLAHEFRTLASMRHPHIISVLDYGFDNDLQPFFTMTLLEKALPVDLAAKKVSHEQKVAYLVHILQALTYLHRRGILHRDLKPGNVLVQNEWAYLVDFGLALDTTYARSHSNTAGTLAYIAPEVLRGTVPSMASDLYSVGVMAYELLTGKHPYDTSTQSKLIQDLLLKPITIEDIELDEPTSLVIARLLSKAPEDRYISALDVIRALCDATNYPVPQETQEIRESFLAAATFVGREDELKTLRQALDDAVAGTGVAWLLGGESGVGKSRLMDELRTYALVKGALTLRGQAVTGGGLPYQLWREILRHLLLMVSVTDEEAYILETIVPDIEHLLNRPIPGYIFDSVAIQKRLPLIIINLLTEAASQKPFVLLLEDLQWAGESLDILKQFLNQVTSNSILVVGNYRSDEAPYLPEQLVGSELMLLNRLSQDDIRKLSARMLGQTGEQQNVVELIQRESEGNAFFIVEVVRTLAEDAGQLSAIGQATLPGRIFAGGMQRIIERRLEHLPDWSVSPTQIAAVNGRQVDQNLMKQLLPQLDIELWLNTCADAAVFTVIEDIWQFAHDKLREHVQDNLEPDKKRQIHQQIAEVIEILHADVLENYAVQLLQHYAAAENREKEAQYAILASDTIFEFNASLARRYAERAIALKAYEMHEKPQQELARLYFNIGRASLRIGEYERARQELVTSLNTYQSIDDVHGTAVAKTVIGEWGYMTGQFAEAVPILEESLEFLLQNEDWRNAGYALMNLGIIQARQNHENQARDYFEKCLEVMQKTGDPVTIAQSYNNLAIILEIQGQFDESYAMHEDALELRRAIKDKRGIAYSLTNLGGLVFEQGRHDQSKAMRQEALQLIREVGDKKAESNGLDSLGMIEFHLENYDIALSYYQSALQIARFIADPFLMNITLRHVGDTYKKLELSGADSYYYEALKILQNTGLLPNKLYTLFDLVKERLEKGEKTFAVQCLTLIMKYADTYRNIEEIENKLEELKRTMDIADYQFAVEAGQKLDLDTLIVDVLQKYKNNG